jgi:hypothetical protein
MKPSARRGAALSAKRRGRRGKRKSREGPRDVVMAVHLRKDSTSRGPLTSPAGERTCKRLLDGEGADPFPPGSQNGAGPALRPFLF